jgi:hypothetical protein
MPCQKTPHVGRPSVEPRIIEVSDKSMLDFHRWAWMAVLAVVVLIPLAVDVKAWDVFRLPKELMFLAFSIVLLVLIAIGFILNRIDSRDAPPYWPLVVAIPGWVAICTIFSQQRLISARSFLATLGGAALVAVTSSIGRRKSLASVGAVLLPAVPNAVLYVLQETRLWNPFIDEKQFEAFIAPSGRDAATEIHSMSFALLGNPSDVGGFFLPPALTLFALAFVLRGRARVVSILGAIVLSTLLVSTQALTAIVALTAAVVSLSILSTQGGVRRVVVGCAVIGSIAAMSYQPARLKLKQTVSDLKSHRYQRLFTGRMAAFIAAWDMAADHKLTGVGPGCFAYEYFDYKLRAEERHPWLLESPSREVNFGEVHNDHLQVLAETGIPGYLLFAAALGVLAFGSFSGSASGALSARDDRAKFSKVISLPLAVCFGILATAQFPLELPAVCTGFLFLAALTVAWRPRVEVD